MRKYFYILNLLLAINAYSSAQTVVAGDSIVNIQDLINNDLPLIVINTINEEEPTCDLADTPEGCIGNTITNATKVPGRMYIILGNDTLYDSKDYQDDKSGLTIKIRGNSSAYFALKKSYKIKLQKKADLLCRGNDAVYKDKDWVLLREDESLTNCMTGFCVAKIMNFTWIPNYEYVNVVMNGIYRGIYLLAESVKRNSDCRIDVDENSGYIIENDPYWWNEDLYFNSSFALNYTFKYPDSDDVTEEQLKYIQKAIDVAEISLDDGTYTEYIDVNSFANWCLTHDLLGTYDEAGSNIFLSKYDSTSNSKFKMETPWDFDTIEQCQNDWANVHNSIAFFYYKLFNSYNPEFILIYKSLWEEKGDSVICKIIEKLDSFEHSALATAIDYYSPLDKKIDFLNYATISEQIEESKQWFSHRKEWLDDAIAKMEIKTVDSTLINKDSIVFASDSVLYVQELMNENLPLIVINTVDKEEPAFDHVETPEGCIGNGITNVTKVPGQMYIILGNDTLYDSKEFESGISGMTIKIGDNNSADSSKKSYTIRLQEKTDLLCRDSVEEYKDEVWTLLRDESNLTNNMTGFSVAKLMDFAWIPSYEYVNVVMNGKYRGIYLLAETVKRNPSCRIDVDEDSGYIIENTPYWWNDNRYFNSSLAFNYTFIYPDSLDVTNEQFGYIQNVVDNVEASLENGTYPEYIDVNSFATWCLTHDLLGSYDEAGSNMFISKYDSTANSKLKMETPWDFDTIERIPDDWANIHKSIGFYYCKLFDNQNSEFEKEFIRIWKEKGDSVVKQIVEQLDSFEHSDLATTIDYYSPLDRKVSTVNYDSIAVQMETSKQWFIDRKAWLDDAIAELEDKVGIRSITFSSPTNKSDIYDLQGRRVKNPKRGVYIKNSKKYIVR